MVEQVPDKKHAVLGPSSASRWMACPGSVKLSEGMPDDTSVYAAWGTVCHEVADRCLTDSKNAEEFIGQKFSSDGFDFEFDMEMADCVNDYLGYLDVMFDPGAGDIVMSEEEVPLAFLTGEEGAVGTSDIIAITNKGKRLVVVDLKTGRGVLVEARDNPQMRIYALGALEKYSALYEDIEEVQTVIAQPRLNHFDEELLTVEELRAFGDEVSIAAGQTQLDDAPLVPGEKQCQWCRAKARCPALRGEVIENVTRLDAATFDNLDKPTMAKKIAAALVTPETLAELGQAKKATTLIRAWCDAVDEEVKLSLEDGQHVPGFKLVKGNKGARKWANEAEAEEELRKRLKVDEAYDRKLISPTKAEEVFKDKPKVWAKIAPLYTQSEGKPIVVPENDKRDAIQVGATGGFENLDDSSAEDEIDPFS